MKGSFCVLRLDKYLKVSRIIKRRTIANEACDAGKVEVNGKPVRASYDVKIGDKILVKLGSKVMEVEVLSLNEHTRKEEACEMYNEIKNSSKPKYERNNEENWQYTENQDTID